MIPSFISGLSCKTNFEIKYYAFKLVCMKKQFKKIDQQVRQIRYRVVTEPLTSSSFYLDLLYVGFPSFLPVFPSGFSPYYIRQSKKGTIHCHLNELELSTTLNPNQTNKETHLINYNVIAGYPHEHYKLSKRFKKYRPLSPQFLSILGISNLIFLERTSSDSRSARSYIKDQ